MFSSDPHDNYTYRFWLASCFVWSKLMPLNKPALSSTFSLFKKEKKLFKKQLTTYQHMHELHLLVCLLCTLYSIKIQCTEWAIFYSCRTGDLVQTRTKETRNWLVKIAANHWDQILPPGLFQRWKDKYGTITCLQLHLRGKKNQLQLVNLWWQFWLLSLLQNFGKYRRLEITVEREDW